MQYVIGIGANIGFTLDNIQKAINEIAINNKIKVINTASLYSSKALLKAGSPDDWDIFYTNTAIRISCELEPLDLLATLKEIELKIGRDLNAPEWSPRIIDLDILSANSTVFQNETLTIPHKELFNRNFALAPLLEIDPLWVHPKLSNTDLSLLLINLGPIQRLNQKLDTSIRMGILNLTSQSFSDGHFDDNQRKNKFIELIDAGAECIDIGAESTKPKAIAVAIDDEWNTLDKFLTYLKSNINELSYKPLISIDTRKISIMQKVLLKYSDIIWMINDVEGNNIEDKADLIAKYGKKYVITHNLGITDRNLYLSKDTAIEEICNFIEEKTQILLSKGVIRDNIYFDVGIGFGKDSETAEHLLNNITKIKKMLKLKTLFAHSRKSSVLGIPNTATIAELDTATKIMSTKLQKLGIDIIRVHSI